MSITVKDAVGADVVLDPPTQTTQAAILAKLIVAPATEAKQDGAIAVLTTLAGYLDGVEAGQASILAKLSADPATQTTLAAILAKLIASPATESSLAAAVALLTTQAGYLDGVETLLGRLPSGGAATETTLAAVLAKLITSPATEATLAAILAKLPAALIGGRLDVNVGAGTVVASGTMAIDQTTPNTTNRVTAALYGKVTNPGDTASMVTAAGRQLVAHGTANTAGAVITGGTVTSMDSTDTARALAVAEFRFNGSTNEPTRTPNKFMDMSAVAIGSIATIYTPTSAKKFRVMGGMISVSAAVSVLFEDNAAGAYILRTPKLLVDTPFAFTLGGNGFLSAAANNVLKATSSAAASITGVLYGTEE